MRLYEKKCPNCGASLEFDENAKSCKCDYCKRTFEVERDNVDSKKPTAADFNLSELKGPLKAFGLTFAGIQIFFFVFTFILIGFFGVMIFKTGFSEGKLYTNVSEFSNSDFGDFDNKAYHTIFTNDDGLDDYHLNMSVKREKVYLAYDKKNKKNIIYTVYKARYEKAFDKENVYTIYVPIKYEDLYKKSSALTFQLDNGKVDAPEYYFNLEHSEYSYGYQSMDELEIKLINPLEDDYKVTKK